MTLEVTKRTKGIITKGKARKAMGVLNAKTQCTTTPGPDTRGCTVGTLHMCGNCISKPHKRLRLVKYKQPYIAKTPHS